MAKDKSEEAEVEPVDPAVILEKFVGQIVPAAELGKALIDGGHSLAEGIEVVSGLLDRGAIRQLGNTGLDAKKNPVGFRFEIPKIEKAQKVWVRAQHGPAVKVPGFGQFDRFGRVLEKAEHADLVFLRSRDVPVEVVADASEVVELEAKAKKRAEMTARKIDKRAAVLADLG